MKSEKIGFGIIGLGVISRLAHIPAFKKAIDKVDIVAVCDINKVRAEEEAGKLGAKAYSDYEELLKDPDVQALDITLPHHLHYPVAKMAIEFGKHVVVEKPLTIIPEQSLELIELAKKNKLKFTVSENTRFVTAYIETKKLLNDGVIGEPRLIRTLISGSDVQNLKSTSSWRGKQDDSGGGVIIDAGAHSFFLIKWLFGEIKNLQAQQAKLVGESQVEDWAIVTGKLCSGSLFSTEYTFTSESPWNERLEIHGSKGLVVVDQLLNPPAIHYKSETDYIGSPLVNVPYDPHLWKFKSIGSGILDFIDAIRENRSPAIDPVDGYYAVKVIAKAYESISSGKSVKVK